MVPLGSGDYPTTHPFTHGEITGYKVFFAFDTGYRDISEGVAESQIARCLASREIGAHLGSFDSSLLPIGLYSP